jgi:formyltetrahydrofolate synthetase
MAIGFSKSLPKVKDLQAVGEVRDFLKAVMDPKIQDDFLEKIAAEKAEVERLLAKNERALREQIAAKDAAETSAMEQEKRLQELIQNSNAKLAGLEIAEKNIGNAQKELDERENIIAEDEADLLKRIKVFEKERAALDETLAAKDLQVAEAVDAAGKAEARHNAAAAKLENKLANIEAAAAR